MNTLIFVKYRGQQPGDTLRILLPEGLPEKNLKSSGNPSVVDVGNHKPAGRRMSFIARPAFPNKPNVSYRFCGDPIRTVPLRPHPKCFSVRSSCYEVQGRYGWRAIIFLVRAHPGYRVSFCTIKFACSIHQNDVGKLYKYSTNFA